MSLVKLFILILATLISCKSVPNTEDPISSVKSTEDLDAEKPSCDFQEEDAGALFCIKKDIKSLVEKTKSSSCLLTSKSTDKEDDYSDVLITLTDLKSKEKKTLSMLFSSDAFYERNDYDGTESILLKENIRAPTPEGKSRASLHITLTKDKKKIKAANIFQYKGRNLNCKF